MMIWLMRRSGAVVAEAPMMSDAAAKMSVFFTVVSVSSRAITSPMLEPAFSTRRWVTRSWPSSIMPNSMISRTGKVKANSTALAPLCARANRWRRKRLRQVGVMAPPWSRAR